MTRSLEAAFSRRAEQQASALPSPPTYPQEDVTFANLVKIEFHKF